MSEPTWERWSHMVDRVKGVLVSATSAEDVARLQAAIRQALDELGVPTAETPAPVVAAVEVLREALRHE